MQQTGVLGNCRVVLLPEVAKITSSPDQVSDVVPRRLHA